MLNKEQIKQIIPHREPFLMIDEILEMEIGVRAVGVKYVTGEEDFFKGHFPGTPVMPGVLIVEALAQTGAVAVLSMEQYKGKIAYFGGIKDAKFKKMVKPGDELLLTVELTKIRGPIGIGEAKATVNGALACSCTMIFAIPEQ